MGGEGSWVHSGGGVEEDKRVGGGSGVEFDGVGDGVEGYFVLEHYHCRGMGDVRDV